MGTCGFMYFDLARPPNLPGTFETLAPQNMSMKNLGRHAPKSTRFILRDTGGVEDATRNKKLLGSWPY